MNIEYNQAIILNFRIIDTEMLDENDKIYDIKLNSVKLVVNNTFRIASFFLASIVERYWL